MAFNEVPLTFFVDGTTGRWGWMGQEEHPLRERNSLDDIEGILHDLGKRFEGMPDTPVVRAQIQAEVQRLIDDWKKGLR